MTKVSVIIPIHNPINSLDNSLQSAMNQQDISTEFICIIDGPSDSSLSICEKYSLNDSRFKVISTPHKGVSSARNTGLDASTGEYICFLDSDDQLRRGALKTLYEHAQKYNCDAIKFNAKTVHGEKWMKESFKKHHNELITDFKPNDIFVHKDCRPFVWMHFIRRDVIEDIRFDESLEIGEDQEFIIRYMINCKRVSFLDKKLYIHNNRPDSLLNNVIKDRRTMCDKHIKVVQKVLTYYDERSPEFNNWAFDMLYGYSSADDPNIDQLQSIAKIFKEMSIDEYLQDEKKLNRAKEMMVRYG